MYTIGNLIAPDSSTPSLPSSTLSTQLQYPHPVVQNRPQSIPHALPTLSLHNTVQPQQQFYHSNLYQSQSQILSNVEWDLIMSFRMMKSLNVLPLFQPSLSSMYHLTDGTALYQATPSSDQTGHQMQGLTHSAMPSSIHPYEVLTTAPPTGPCIAPSTMSSTHSYAATTTSQQLSYVQEIQCSIAQPQPQQQPQTIAVPSPSVISMDQKHVQSFPSSKILSSSQTPISSQSHSTPQTPPPPSPTLQMNSTPHTPPPQMHSTAQTTPPQMCSISETSPQTQSAHRNRSNALEQQLYSCILTSPPTVITSPLQRGKKSFDQNLIKSSHPLQSIRSSTTTATTFDYNPTVVGPIIQLLDPKKPYSIGDKIKVGGRTLQSDSFSLKYWAEDDITVTETASGGHILNMAGYSYFIKNIGKNFTTWECEHRRNQRCSSIVIRSSDPTVKSYFRIYSIQGEHFHDPTPENIDVRAFKQRVRDRCRLELSSPRTIYDDELRRGKYSGDMLTILPTFYNMQAHLYRIRQENLPTSPTDPKFILHPAFMSTDKGERFLLYDSNAAENLYPSAPTEVGRLLIYASDLQLMLLSGSKLVASDGTFETSAQISQQNYIIMGEFEEMNTVPLVFCLCEKKNYETYLLIIQVLKTALHNRQLDFEPMYWMSDYEAALTKAIKEEMPNIHLLGCAFHYNQAIYRNIQAKGLQDAYQNVEVIRQILRNIMALAFLPNDQIKKMYDNVIKPQFNNVPRKPAFLRLNLRSFFKYYESQWLKNIHHFCVFNQSTRTNNALEGYNNKMSAQLAVHPHLYRLITWFEKEEVLVQQLVMKVTSGAPVYKRKQAARTIRINDSLQSLWDSYNGGKICAQELLLESSKWIAKKT